MKKFGILNSEISKILSDMGHTDYICISDLGLPIPDGVKKIDLSVKRGVPSFLDILDEVSKDMVIEKVILAEEVKIENKQVLNSTIELLKTNNSIKNSDFDYISHLKFKELTKHAKAIIRTGENSPYANIILYSNVNF